MGLEQALPDLREGKGIKDIIIHVLSEEWPLSSNEIYNTAKRKYGLDSTYQAVHKMLKQLANQGVLVREGKQYSISIKWAEKIEKFSKDLKTTLVSHRPLYLEGLSDFREETGMQTFVFDSFGAAEEYRKTLQKQYIETPGPKEPYVGQSRHLKSPIVYSEKSLSILNAIRRLQTDCYLLVAGKTTIDDWCASYYQNEFVRIKTGCDVAKTCDTMVLGEVIAQIYIPQEIQEYIDKIYKEAEKISDINIPKFNRAVYEKKATTKIIVYRNAEIANQIRKQAIEYFNKGISLFDIDGTLVDGIIPVEFAKHLTKKSLFKKEILKKMELTINNYDLGKVAYAVAANEILKLYARGVKGLKEETVKEEAKRFVDTPALKFFEYSTDLVGTLRQKGRVVAITGSPIEVIEPLRKMLPFDEIFATVLEKNDGVYTGKIAVNMALGEEKSRTIREFFEKEGGQYLFGFGDTGSDVTLLQQATIAIALNPNKELAKIAKKRRWKILTEEDDIVTEIKNLAKKFDLCLHK